MEKVESVGIVDVLYFTTALNLVDDMCKHANIKLLRTENALGGKLVTIFIAGSTSDVSEAIDYAQTRSELHYGNRCKNALMITNPHPEILKFII